MNDIVTVIAVPAAVIGIPLILWVVASLGIFTIDSETEEEEKRHVRKW